MNDFDSLKNIYLNIFENISTTSNKPGQFAKYLSKKLKEIFETKTVLISLINTDNSFDIFDISPSKKIRWASSNSVSTLIEESLKLKNITYIDQKTGSKQQKNILLKAEINNAILLPLLTNNIKVGSILFIDMLDISKKEKTIKTIEKQANFLALVMYRSSLFQNLENKVKQRTEQLEKQNKEHELIKEELRNVNESFSIAIKNIEESEQQFRSLFENMEQGFAFHQMIYDKNNKPVDYKFVLVNKAFESLTGIKIKGLKGRTVKEVLPDTEQIWIEKYAKVAETLIPIRFSSYSAELKKYYSVVAYSQKKGYFATIFNDITDQKNYQDEILKAKEKAEEADLLKSTFLANMSHEIRTPMNGILGFAKLLKNKEITSEQTKKYISIIEKSGERMLNIINDLIDISKIESGHMDINFKNININDQINELYSFFKTEAENAGLLLILHKYCNNPCVITTDPDKLYAILANLIKNAIKYSTYGEIKLGYNVNNDFIEFFVTDTGVGIPKERTIAIFERFVQADLKDKDALEGAGLGLAISKAYVEMLGGTIWVKSDVNMGADFRFTIPNNTNVTATDIKLIHESHPDFDIPKLNILLAEDDTVSEMHMSIILNDITAKLFTAKNGAEAIKIFENNPDIDLILMDIKMPIMNGIEAVNRIRKKNKNIIIIAQTAFAMPGDREKFLKEGFNGHITKPIEKDKLMKEIQSNLRQL